MTELEPDLRPYAARLNASVNEKIAEFQSGRRPKHVLFAQQFDRAFLDRLGKTADELRILSRLKESALEVRALLPHKRAMLYFTQESTRTFMSFMAACHLLGMATSEIRDPRLSSEYKGESPLDSMRMFSAYSDVIVVRSKVPQFAEVCAYLMNDLEHDQRAVPIINGGSGADEHPTQALLDMFTLQRTFGAGRGDPSTDRFHRLQQRDPGLEADLDGKTYAFVGDIGRGRTVRSLCTLLAGFRGVTFRFVSPDRPKMRLQDDLAQRLRQQGIAFTEHHSLDEVVADVDIVYMTRVQSEHDKAGDALTEEEREACRLTPERADRMRPHAAILHPFPRNDEIPAEVDANPRAMYFHQARNGIWVRAALMCHIFDVDTDVRELYDRFAGEHRSYNASVL